jgi:molybdopterin-guanine dinucleotide biosynthesis protein A
MHADEPRRIEPLAALYRREAFLREGMPVLLSGEGALRLVIDRLETRFMPVRDERAFTNVNTPSEYDALRETLVP